MSPQLPELHLLPANAASLGIPLNTQQLRAFAILAAHLLDANERINLTAVTDLADVEVKHFVDSLTVAPVVRQEFQGREARLVDVGTGAGFPGIPLAIVLPTLRVALLEATGKKARFLEQVLRTAEVLNARVLQGRAEQLGHQPEYRQAFDVTTARAVGSVATLVELLLPFLRVGGLAVLMKTRTALEHEVPRAEGALQELHGAIEEVRNVEVPGLGDRALVLIRKIGDTPAQYPRRAGIPGRRPIAG